MKKGAIFCGLALCSMVGVESQTWPERPFQGTEAEAFNWTPEDSAGMAYWLTIRQNWADTHQDDIPTAVGGAVESKESVLAWWLRGRDAGWALGCLGFGLVLGLMARQFRSRQKERQRKQAGLEKWPALEVLAHGSGNPMNPQVMEAAANAIRDLLVTPTPGLVSPPWPQLNESEAECAHLTLQRMSTREIADIMHCTTKHVYNLRTSIRKKLDIPTESDLVSELMRRASS